MANRKISIGSASQCDIPLTRGAVVAQLKWEVRIGAKAFHGGVQCSAAAIWDGSNLYIAGDPTTINGVT